MGSSNKGSNSSNNNITSSSNSYNNTSIMFKYQIYNNMMNMIIYTCNISNSCKTNNTILFKLKCTKKSPKICPLLSMNPHQEAGVATPPHQWVCPTPPQIMANSPSTPTPPKNNGSNGGTPTGLTPGS